MAKNDFIVSRFLKVINKLKYNSLVFSFYPSVSVLLLSLTVRKIFTFYFFVLTDCAICCSFSIYISMYLHNLLYYLILLYEKLFCSFDTLYDRFLIIIEKSQHCHSLRTNLVF